MFGTILLELARFFIEMARFRLERGTIFLEITFQKIVPKLARLLYTLCRIHNNSIYYRLEMTAFNLIVSQRQKEMTDPCIISKID